jgi:hypothetical protein
MLDAIQILSPVSHYVQTFSPYVQLKSSIYVLCLVSIQILGHRPCSETEFVPYLPFRSIVNFFKSKVLDIW